MDTKNIKSDLRTIYNNNPNDKTIQDLTIVIDNLINMIEALDNRLQLIEHRSIPKDLPNLKIPKNNIPKEKNNFD